MSRSSHALVALTVLVTLFNSSARVDLPAQLRPHTVGELPGEEALRLMLRKLASTGTFMQTTAHPDDEDNALLAMLGHGEGMRTVLVSATRGNGGQNEIGPELFEALGVLRTEELLAAHRFDGAEQSFTRAIDFGYSFSVEESLALWGHDETLGDFVRHIRTVRPGVIAGLNLIDADELALGDLSRYHVIVAGVRAHERRPDLRANNHRLIAYVENGGVVLVQYNKFEFNDAQYGPYPAKVSAERVTSETAPVEILIPDHPIFNHPNRIGPEAWSNWVQERGLYFLGERDRRYVDLVRLTEPFEFNKGARTGALVEARVGKGTWIYIGLGLWRQLPAGTDGAYQLPANLLSLGARDSR